MARPTNESRITGYLLVKGKATADDMHADLGLRPEGIAQAVNNLLDNKTIKAGRPAANPVYSLVNPEKIRKAYAGSKVGIVE